MAISKVYSGYYRAHSALVGNSLCVGNGGAGGVTYITPAGGTTNNYLLNGSRAVFNQPPGSTIIYAELVLATTSFGNAPGDTITFQTPTSTNTLSYGTLNSIPGWSAYTQDVTALVTAGGAGTYTVSRVNCNITVGVWYFYVVYTNPTYPYKYIYYARGVEEVTNVNTPINFVLNDVYTPSSGPLEAYTLLGSTAGDTLDKGTISFNGTFIGNPSVGTWNGLPPYNPSTNIMPGIICIADTNNPNAGLLDTSGTFGNANNNPYTNVNPNPNRTWCDITGINCSNALTNGISSILVSFNIPTTYASGFVLNTLALEITAYIPPTKIVDKPYANVGDILTYSIGLINAATVPYTNVVITDTLPTGTSFVANSLTLNGTSIPGNPAPPGGVNIGTIAVNNASTITFQVLVSSTIPSPNPIMNQSISTFNIGTDTQVLFSDYTSTTISTAILSSSKSVSSLFANLVTTLTYTVAFSNLGSVSANNVILMDTIPFGTTFVPNSVSINGITSLTANPALPGINLGSIGANTRTTVSFNVLVSATVPYPISLPNNSQITYNYLVGPSNQVFTQTTTNTVLTTLSTAVIQTSKSVNKLAAVLGDVLTYTIPITNTGTTIARSIIFIDTVPSGTTFVPNSLIQDTNVLPGNPNPPGVVLSDLSPNTTSTISFQVTVTTLPSSGVITNFANISYTYTVNPSTTPIIQVTTATETNTISTSSTAADLTNIIKSVNKTYTDRNTILTYTIAFSNLGNTTANNVILMDTIPSGTTFVANSVNINGINNPGANPALPGINLVSIGPNIRTTVSFNVLVAPTVPYPISLPNNSQVTYNYSAGGAGTIFTQATSNTVLTTLSTAVIQTSKSVNKLAAVLGDVLTYTIPITNLGTTIARNVVLLDTVPSGTTFVPNSLRQDTNVILGTPDPPGVTLNNIPAGGTSTVSFQVTVTTLPSSGSITNSANISYTYTVDPSTTPIIVVTTATNTNTATTSAGAADLSNITKSVSKSYTDVNTTLTYTVAFTNVGNVTTNNVVFMDTVPSGSTFITGSVNINGVNSITANPALPGINLGSIGPNIRTTITFNIIAAPTVPYPNSLTNNAQATYNYTAGGGSVVFTQATSNSVVTTISGAVISTSKRVNKTFATVGDVFNYTLPLTNSGTTVARNVVFVDTLANGLTFVTNSIRQDGAVIPGSPASPGVTLNNIAPNTTSTISFQAVVTSIPTSGVISNTGSFSYTYTVDPATTPIIQTTTTTNTNSTTTTISAAILSPMTKGTDKYYARCGDVVTFTITIPNSGNATAINVIFTDTIPPGTTFVSNSVIVNGTAQPGATPVPPTGINIGNIGPGSSSVIQFKVNVSC